MIGRKCQEGVLKDQAFGPLIWNIFQNDLAYSVNSSLNMYADDHQFYAAGNTITDVHDNLTASAESASRWYRCNFLKGNFDKNHCMTLGNKNDPMESIIN